jgi:hypothetical protein
VSQDRPDIQDLLQTVQEFLDSCVSRLDGEMRYHARVASHLLGICAREIALSPALDTAERSRLCAVLGSEEDLGTLERRLGTEIRDGTFDDRFDDIVELLLQNAIEKLAVVRPDHLAPMHRERAARFGTSPARGRGRDS